MRTPPTNKKLHFSKIIFETGVTIYNEDKKFANIMEKAAQSLNLKPHTCGLNHSQILSSAADIEGHLGTDQQYYLLDFSRTMPPVQPNKKQMNGHLYQLFRREFLVKYGRPLCSDAFSGFIIQDPEREEHNEEVREATQYLMDIAIPSCAEEMAKVCLRK